MADNLDDIIARLRREESYHQDRLRLIFGVSFRKADEAYDKYQRYEQKRGYDRAAKRMQEAPRKFGRLKGRLVFGFWKDEARRNAELSLKKLQHHARELHLTRLQIREAETKKNEQNIVAEQQTRQQEATQIRTENADQSQASQSQTRQL